MKKLLIIITGLLLTSGYSGFSQDSGELVVPFSDPAKPKKVIVDLRRGSIEVVGSNRQDVLIYYEPTDSKRDDNGTSSDGLKRIASASMNLEISEKDNTIEIESDSWNKGVNVKVEVPYMVDLHVESYNDGDLFVSNIKGEVVADSQNGRITAENISGSLIADTYNGAIRVTFDEIKPDTPMAFSTYNGDIDLTLPASFKGTMKMRTARGDILSGFDFTLEKSEPETKKDTKTGTYKVYMDEWVRGRINGGGPEFMLKNYNGNIYLRKK